MSEETPLLNSVDGIAERVVPRKRKVNYGFWLGVILSVTFIIASVTALTLHVSSNLGDYVDQMCDFEVSSMSFAGVAKDGGINVVVQGDNTIDYDSLDDSVARKLFKTGGIFLRSLNLKVDKVDMLVWDDKSDKYTDLGSVRIQPFRVGIVNKRVTPLELLVTVYPDSDAVFGMLKKMLRDPDAQFKIYGDANVRVMVFNGFLPVSKLKIPMDFALPRHLINLSEDNVHVKDLAVETDTDFKVSFTTVISDLVNVGLPLGFFVPEVNWKLSLDDCFGHPSISVLDFTTGKMELSTYKPFEFKISSSVSSLPAAVNDKCKDGKTPLSHFLGSAVDDSQVKFSISGTKNDNLPVKVNQILEKVSVPVSLKLDVKDKLGSLLKNVTMDDISVQIPDPSKEPTLDGTLKIFLTVPKFLRTDVNVTNIRGTADLSYNSEKFGEIDIKDWRHATTEVLGEDEENAENYIILIQALLEHLVLHVTDLALFEKIVQVVFGSGSATIDIDALVDLLAQCFLGELTIEKVRGGGSASIGI